MLRVDAVELGAFDQRVQSRGATTTGIADHPARQFAELLPWNWHPALAYRAAA